MRFTTAVLIAFNNNKDDDNGDDDKNKPARLAMRLGYIHKDDRQAASCSTPQ